MSEEENKEETFYGIPIEKAKELMGKFNPQDESFRMKFMLVLPYFLPQALFQGLPFADEEILYYKTASVINLNELAERLRLNLDDLIIFLQFFNVTITNAEYKSMKNQILEKIDLPVIELTEEDKHEFFVTPYFIQEMRAYEQENIFPTQIDQSLLLYDNIIGNLSFGKKQLFEYISKVFSFNRNEMMEGIIIDFLLERIHKNGKIVEEMDYSQDEKEIIKLTLDRIYNLILKDIRLIELNTQYNFNWIYLFSKIYKLIRKLQVTYKKELVNEIQKQQIKEKKIDQDISQEKKSKIEAARANALWKSIEKHAKENWVQTGERIKKQLEFEENLLYSYLQALIGIIKEIRRG